MMKKIPNSQNRLRGRKHPKTGALILQQEIFVKLFDDVAYIFLTKGEKSP